MLLRWLLPIVAVFALLGNAVAAFAAAGTFGQSTCCCPNPKTCKCHDHDKPPPDDQMRRCAGDAIKVVPTLQTVDVPPVLESVVVLDEAEVEHVTILKSDQYVTHPEKPPF